MPKKSKKKSAKTPITSFKEGQTVKRIDIFRLFSDDELSWMKWNKEKKDWERIPFKTEVKDIDFTITKVKTTESGYVVLEAKSETWRIRWMKKPNAGWGFITILRNDLLKHN